MMAKPTNNQPAQRIISLACLFEVIGPRQKCAKRVRSPLRVRRRAPRSRPGSVADCVVLVSAWACGEKGLFQQNPPNSALRNVRFRERTRRTRALGRLGGL